MRFLRENVFLLILLAVVLVLGGIILAMDFSTASAVDKLITDRVRLGNELRSLGRGNNRVNQEVVTAERDRVATVRKAARDLLKQSRDWNRRNYRIIRLQYKDDDGAIKTVPSFPVDRRQYQSFGLALKFTGQCSRELLSLLKRLNATRPPSKEEIKIESVIQQRALDLRRQTEEQKKAKADQSPARKPSPGFSSGGYQSQGGQGQMMEFEGSRRGQRYAPQRGAFRSRRSGRARTADLGMSSGSASAEAVGIARRSLQIQRARAGHIYVTPPSLDPVFTIAVASTTDTKLWEAQVNLWVTEDIVEAIRQTNDQVLKQFDENDRNVLNAAVKRLVGMEVSEQYYTGGTAAGSTTVCPTGPQGGMVPGMMGGQSGSGGFGQGGTGMGLMPMGGMMGGGQRPSGGKTKGEPLTLTERSSCKLYDVIHYEFTVVMSTSHISRLQQNLMRRNNHTIINVAIEPLGTRGGYGAAGRSEELYYYGTEPMVQVKLMGELLLLTSWERGTWDPKGNRWSDEFPPLMPTEVLRKLNDANPDALREEDEKLLTSRS